MLSTLSRPRARLGTTLLLLPQRFLEPRLECTPGECGQRSGPLLPPFTDASYPRVEGTPVKASQL